MIDGIWWLVMLLAVVAAFWLVAKTRGAKADETFDNKSPKGAKRPSNDDLQKTAVLINNYFPDYRVNRKANHLVISEQNKKIAMITIDKKVAAGQRRLGDVPVINYHRVPNRAQLTANLQDAE